MALPSGSNSAGRVSASQAKRDRRRLLLAGPPKPLNQRSFCAHGGSSSVHRHPRISTLSTLIGTPDRPAAAASCKPPSGRVVLDHQPAQTSKGGRWWSPPPPNCTWLPAGERSPVRSPSARPGAGAPVRSAARSGRRCSPPPSLAHSPRGDRGCPRPNRRLRDTQVRPRASSG